MAGALLVGAVAMFVFVTWPVAGDWRWLQRAIDSGQDLPFEAWVALVACLNGVLVSAGVGVACPRLLDRRCGWVLLSAPPLLLGLAGFVAVFMEPLPQ